MATQLPDGSVKEALAEAADYCGGWNHFVGDTNSSRSSMSHWVSRNEVPPVKAKMIETVTGGLVKRERLSSLYL